MEPLKLATAATVKLGPFVDSTDGVTAETGLTIQKADVRLSVNGGNMAAAHADQGGSDAGAPHDELGYYDISLDTTDTATRGRLKIMVQETGALPCWVECEVLDPEVYDALYSTGTLPVDLQTIKGRTVNDPGGEVTVPTSIGTSTYAGGAVASVTAGVTLADDAITAAKFDESTAYPLKSADTGATAVARTGADSDTLETLSDQLDAIDISAIEDSVLDAATSDHTAAGSVGLAIATAGAAADPLLNDVPGSYAAGTAGYVLGTLAGAGGIEKNVALPDFGFGMVSSANHSTLKAGLAVTAKRKIDGGAWASCANAVSEVSGTTPSYSIDLDAADLNGKVIMLLFEASGADPRLITIVTQG